MTLCTPLYSRSHLGFVLCSVLSVIACAGSGAHSAASEAPAASEGEEPPPEPDTASEVDEPTPIASAITQATTTGRGSIVVSARVNGQPVAARVKLLDVSQGLEGATGESISLPAGTQRISVSIAETQALLDKPTQNLSVFVEPGKPTAVDVKFRWARVRLDVLVGGHSQGSVPVKLFRNGEAVAELKAGAAPQAISPGKYEADVMLRGRTIHVTGLVFLEGAEQTVPVRTQL